MNKGTQTRVMEDSLQDDSLLYESIFQRTEITAVARSSPARTLLTAISSLLQCRLPRDLALWYQWSPRSSLLDAAFILEDASCAILSLVLLIRKPRARDEHAGRTESVPDDQDRDSPPPH